MTNKILSFLLFFSLKTVLTFANPADSIQAAKCLNEAIALLEQADWENAQKKQKEALALYQKNERLDMWLDCQIPFAYTMADVLKQPFEAKRYLDQALATAWRQPKTSNEWVQWIRVSMNRGHLCRWYTFDYTKAVKYFEESFRLYVKHLDEKNDRIASYIYHQLGNSYTQLGDYERAEKMLRRGIEYGHKNQNLEIGKYGDLAIVLIDLGKNKEALEMIDEGIQKAKMPTNAAITARFSEARAWLNLGNVSRSRQAAEKALGLIHQLEDDAQGIAYYKAGYFSFLAGLESSADRKKAEFYHKKAIESEIIAQGSVFSREVGLARCDLANFYLKQDQPGLALKEYQKGMQSVILGFKPKNEQENPGNAHLLAESTIAAALIGKARAFLALNQLEKSLECYELIPIVEAKLRATHAYESSSLLALKESRQRFHEAIDIAWQLFERSNGNPKYAERAFRLTELARGMLLLQSLVQARQHLPNDIQEKDYELRVRMAWLEHQIADERESGEKEAPEKLKTWERQLFDLKLERQKLLSEFPSYNSPDSLFLQVLAAQDVPKLLRKGQALVSFFLTEEAAYIFSFDAQGNFQWRKTPLLKSFREQTRSFAAYLSAGEAKGQETFLQHAWYLDDLLLAPERKRWGKQTNSLLIVPDDVLMRVPFEVLLSRQAASGSSWRDQAWLLAEYNIGYAYSATLLKVQQEICAENEKVSAKPPHNFGGFAPNYSSSSVYKLQNTQPMVENVCDLLGGEKWLNGASSEAKFKAAAANYRTLLLAMHGISDSEHPELSHLLFGDPGPDSAINNNVLYASELQIMRLQADLVVLSACHSGSGKIEQGEGVYSLARAFAAARVPATVMSLWLLHENTAPPLVEAFFAYLQQGKTKDEALRQAKLDFLKDDRNFEMTHPFFWAGLVASGDMRALDLPQKAAFGGKWWWVLLPLLAFIALFAVRRFQQSKKVMQ
jgi:CHAT domain-containing protein